MKVSAAALRVQFDRCLSEGWWPLLAEAAARSFPEGEFDAADLFAIGSRESSWDPRYLREPGDRGNGYGPLQIDRRSFPEWVDSGAWRIPREAIRKGAEVLRAKLDDTRAMQGRALVVRDRSGGSFKVVGKQLSALEELRVALAAYNCGRWAHYHVSKGRSPDHGTTGRDYSTDVAERAATARPWAPARSQQGPCPLCGRG